MKHLRRLRGVLCLALALALPAAFCRAEAPAAEEKGLELAEGRISVRYPAVTGLEDEELLRRVNDRRNTDAGRTAPAFIVLTQVSTPSVLMEANRSGASLCLQKPVDFDVLLSGIATILKNRQTRSAEPARR